MHQLKYVRFFQVHSTRSQGSEREPTKGIKWALSGITSNWYSTSWMPASHAEHSGSALCRLCAAKWRGLLQVATRSGRPVAICPFESPVPSRDSDRGFLPGRQSFGSLGVESQTMETCAHEVPAKIEL